MTQSTLKTPGSRAIQVAALLIATAPVTFAGARVDAESARPLIDHMVVTATREVPVIGSMVVTGQRSPVTLVANLGAMTVTAEREPARVANLVR